MSDLKWLINFKSPRNKVELMTRVVDWAKAEERWMQGALCEVRSDKAEQYRDEYGSTRENLVKADDVQVCESVGACLMGIMGIAFWNGGFVKGILSHTRIGTGKFTNFNESDNHGPVWAGGVKALYEALPEEFRETYRKNADWDDEKGEYRSLPEIHRNRVTCIEAYNDNGSRKHEEIVEVTQRALEIVKG